MSVTIPKKSSFKLDEVCQLVEVKPYILRFWESEFDQIKPITSASGQKIYEHKDIAAILRIKDLLITQKLSVERAKGQLLLGPGQAKQRTKTPPSPKTAATPKAAPKRERPRKSIAEMTPLEASNLQKLVLAKAKLRSIISQAKSVQNLLNGPQ